MALGEGGGVMSSKLRFYINYTTKTEDNFLTIIILVSIALKQIKILKKTGE